jgi:hypothetical protein
MIAGYFGDIPRVNGRWPGLDFADVVIGGATTVQKLAGEPNVANAGARAYKWGLWV